MKLKEYKNNHLFLNYFKYIIYIFSVIIIEFIFYNENIKKIINNCVNIINKNIFKGLIKKFKTFDKLDSVYVYGGDQTYFIQEVQNFYITAHPRTLNLPRSHLALPYDSQVPKRNVAEQETARYVGQFFRPLRC